MVLRKLNFSLPPLNSTNAGFSPKNGYPIIRFSIPSQMAFLETSSLRLTGRYQVKPTSTTLLSPSGTDYSKIFNNPNVIANLQTCSALTFPSFGGVGCAIDKVVIQSKKSQAELTSDNNYSTYLSLKTSRYGTREDFRTSLPCRSLSLGENAVLAQRRLNISDVTATTEDQGQEFSIKLDVDLLQNNILHLGDDHLGGLLITLHLSPESAFFSNFQNGTTTAPVTDIEGFRYVFQNVKLEGRYLIPSVLELKNYPPQLVLDNQINLLQDVHSSKSQTVLTPQASIVKGILNLFLIQNQTNNFTQSQYNFNFPIGLREITQNKNSGRYPLKFSVKSVPNYTTAGSVDVATMYYAGLQTNHSEVRMHFEKALNNGNLSIYTSSGLVLTEKAMKQMSLANSAPTFSNNLDVDVMGIGVDYTFGMGQSQNFKNQDYALNLSSGVQTADAKLLPVYSNSSLLQQVFVRNTSIFNTETLIKSN